MSFLDVDGLLSDEVVSAEGGVGCGSFLKYDNSKVYHIDSFHN